MFSLKSPELIKAQVLVDEGKYEDALRILEEFKKDKNNSFPDIIECHLLNCESLFHQGLYDEALSIAEQTYKDSLQLGDNILTVDILYWMVMPLISIFELDRAYDKINRGETLLEKLTIKIPRELNRIKAYTEQCKGFYYRQKDEFSQALHHYEKALTLWTKIDDKLGISVTLIDMSWVLTVYKGKLDEALELLKRGLAFLREKNKKFYVAIGLNVLAAIYSFIGKLDRSIEYFEQCIRIFKELNNKSMMAWIINNLAIVYMSKGPLNHALEYAKQALVLHNELGGERGIISTLSTLIGILVTKGDIKQAQDYLKELKLLSNKLNINRIKSIYKFNKALILKSSSRSLNRGKAEEILKQILEDTDLSYQDSLSPLLELCDLLLFDLQLTHNSDVLEELKVLISKLYDITEKSHSYELLGETHLLQAKLALINFELERARQYLTQGQKIAEKYNLNLLARKISNEHDELLKRMDMWENLKETKAPLEERMKFARLNEQMENMVQKRLVEVPEGRDEDPVLLLIISEGGTPLFSQSFVENQSFEDHLFGGFFTAINSFIKEKFSEGLDRASFGEHTLLMNSISHYFVCYVYRGQSYSAQRRIKSFINELQSNKVAWETFEKFYKLNKEIQLKDIPSLESLIKDVFIEKTIQLAS